MAKHFRRARGAHTPDLVLKCHKGAALVSIGLDLVAKLLSGIAELGVPRDLRFGALGYKLGAISGVALD